jgi:hypothetical protein
MIITKDTFGYVFFAYEDQYWKDLLQGLPAGRRNNNFTRINPQQFGNKLDYQVQNYYMELISTFQAVARTEKRQMGLFLDKQQLDPKYEMKSTGVFSGLHLISQFEYQQDTEVPSLRYRRNQNNWGFIIKNWNGKIIDWTMRDGTREEGADVISPGINYAFQSFSSEDEGRAIIGKVGADFEEVRNHQRLGHTYVFLMRPANSIERPLTKTLCLTISSQERDKTKYTFGTDCVIKLNPINGGYKYYKAVIKSFHSRLHALGYIGSGIGSQFYNLCSKGLNYENLGEKGSFNYEKQSGRDDFTFMGAFKIKQDETINPAKLMPNLPSYNCNILTIKDESYTRDITFKTFIPSSGREPNADNITIAGVNYPYGWIREGAPQKFDITEYADWIIEMVLYGYN